MKKILSLLFVLAIILSTCVLGIGTVASAATESAEEDFSVFEGILEEYLGAGGDVVIPASLGVKEIAAQAFFSNKDITSLVIPEGVEVIGEKAFSQCANIELLTLPYSLEEIGSHAFSRVAVTKLTIPGNVEVVEYGAFVGAEYLTELTLSYGVKEILPLAFSLCAVERVVFPETVELICGFSFSNNKNGEARGFEWIICNPSCEITGYADTARKSFNHEWISNKTPWCDNVKDREHKIVVPEGSSIERQLKNEYNEDWLKANSDSGKSDKYRVVLETEKYFEDLEENQEGYGTQKPEENKDNTDGQGNSEDTNGSNKNPQGSNGGNNSNSNSNGNPQYVTQTDSSMSMAIIIVGCIFGGIMLIAILAVVILVATGKLGGAKKEKKPEVNMEEFEAMKAQLAALQGNAQSSDEQTENE